MKKAIAICHIAFEDLGTWEPLIKADYQLEYKKATDPTLEALNQQDIDLLIVLGGPIGVYQEKEYPFISIEIQLIQERLKKNLPILGICLGAQLIARALGTKVYPNTQKEIGWFPLILTEKGKKSFAHHLSANNTSMFHWHGDTFDLPDEAELLASSALCKNQIFTFNKCLAIQCHPEVSAVALEDWWIGHTGELTQEKLNINNLRDESKEREAQLKTHSCAFLNTWLEQIKN